MVGTRSRHGERDEVVGKQLRAARERKGVSVEEAARELTIPPGHLVSLEEGELTAFAAEVYARGAFHTYASYLGINTPALQQAFLRSLSQARERVPLSIPRPRNWWGRLTSRSWLVLGVAGVAVIIGSYVGWQVQSFLRVPSLALEEPSVAVVYEPRIEVRGRAEREAKVRVNGEAVLVARDGVFRLPLTLHPGINVLQIEAENAAGRSRIIQKDLLFARQ
jgi:cytoskeletal protein RodZ